MKLLTRFNLLPLLFLLLSAFGSKYHAQDYFYKGYDWKAQPDTFALSEEDKKSEEIVVFMKYSVNLVQYQEQLYEYVLTHHITKINSDKAIERNNKFYVSNGNAIEIKTQKARVINPDGKIYELSQKDIKENKDADGNVEYQYFALEGIQVGSVIEYLDLIVRSPRLTGSSINVQSKFPQKNIELDIISPTYLEYLVYNNCGLPEFKKDSTTFFSHRVAAKIDYMEGLEEEDWSTYRANLKKYYFKFNKNTRANTANFYSYVKASQNIYSNIFTEPSKKELGAIKKFVSRSGADKLNTAEEKVRAVENLFKKEVQILGMAFEQELDINFMLDKKVTSNNGFARFMISVFRHLEIPTELVITCDRNKNRFLTEFEGYNFLEDFLIYVPATKQYISDQINYRAGITPEEFMYNKGLFIAEVAVGDMKTGVGKVKYIDGPSSDKSVDEMQIKVRFNEAMDATTVDLRRISTGYKALPYQGVFMLMEEEDRKKFQESYFKYLDEEAAIADMQFENEQVDMLGIKPLDGKATLTSQNFLEKGGNNYLFKVGMLIGPQSQLYNKSTRKNPVETPYTRRYVRKIEVSLPAGYQLKNPQDLKMEILPDGGKSVGFKSAYTLNGQQLIIEIEEWYNDQFYPVADYPKYESVINAAADFNKLVLLLEKQP